MDLPLKKGIHPFSFHPSISQFWVNLHIETRIDIKTFKAKLVAKVLQSNQEA